MSKYDLLQLLYVGTDRRVFAPLHFATRKFYQGPLRSFVKWRLASAFRSSSFDLIVRHSAINGSGFNLFGSDLDCTMILDRPFSLQESDEALLHYNRIKTSLPMLGELEIFSKSEWQALQRILNDHGDLLQLLRNLKKIRWMEWKLKSPSHPYHAIKAKRAIRRVLEKYETNIPSLEQLPNEGNHRYLGEGLARRLRELVPVDQIFYGKYPKAFSLYSRELHVTAGSGNKDLSALCLEPKTALCLLSLYPSHEDDDAEILQHLNSMRESPELRPLYVAVMIHDLIYANASPRVHVQHRNTSWQWTESLLRQLKRILPENEFQSIFAVLNYHRSNENGLIEAPISGKEVAST